MGFPVGRISPAGSRRSQEKLQITSSEDEPKCNLTPAGPPGGAGMTGDAGGKVSRRAAAPAGAGPGRVAHCAAPHCHPVTCTPRTKSAERQRVPRCRQDSVTFTAPGCTAGRMNEPRAADPHPFIMQPTDGCTFALLPPLVLSAPV